MLRFRVIPCLLIQDRSLVKSIGFKNHRYIGDPINTIRIYNESEADELLILDISKTIENKEPDYYFLEQIVSESFMPVCYGGGINSLEIAKRLFSIGVEKISINHSVLDSLDIISKLSSIYGTQSLVVSVDIYKTFFGNSYIYSYRNNKIIKRCPIDYISECVQSGAGEVLVNDIKRDGTMIGYNLDIFYKIAQSINVPVISLGGAGEIEDLKHVKRAGLAAAGAGSLFIYQNKNRNILINYPNEAQLDEICS